MQKLLNKINYHRRILQRFGLSGMLLLISLKFKSNKRSDIKLRRVDSPIYLSNYGPDITTLLQIFFAKEYDIVLKHAPKFIIDCGANIGLSAVYFANKYPSATIIAIEPDKINFDFLRKNCSCYSNITCLNKAVWSHSTKVTIVDNNTGNWGLSTIESSDSNLNSIPTVSIEMVMKEFNIPEIDILKIDIEGAEKELFKHNFQKWLSKTKVMAIELHDDALGSVSETFYNAINMYDYRKYSVGENLVCHFKGN